MYTPRARTAVNWAHSIAHRDNCEAVETKYLLWGLLETDPTFLQRMGINMLGPNELGGINPGVYKDSIAIPIARTIVLANVINTALAIARDANASAVDLEHLLLGLLQVPSQACDILKRHGASLEKVRETILRRDRHVGKDADENTWQHGIPPKSERGKFVAIEGSKCLAVGESPCPAEFWADSFQNILGSAGLGLPVETRVVTAITGADQALAAYTYRFGRPMSTPKGVKQCCRVEVAMGAGTGSGFSSGTYSGPAEGEGPIAQDMPPKPKRDSNCAHTEKAA